MAHRRSGPPSVSCGVRLKPVVFHFIGWLTTQLASRCRQWVLMRSSELFWGCVFRRVVAETERSMYAPPRNLTRDSYTCLWRPLVFAVQTRHVGFRKIPTVEHALCLFHLTKFTNSSAFAKWDTQQCNRKHRKWNRITETSSSSGRLSPGWVPVQCQWCGTMILHRSVACKSTTSKKRLSTRVVSQVRNSQHIINHKFPWSQLYFVQLPIICHRDGWSASDPKW